ASFEVVEPELAFEVFVHSLGSPTLFEDANDFLFAHTPRERGEDELARLRVAVEPLGNEPERLAIGERDSVVVKCLDANEAEAAAKRLIRSFAPGESSKLALHSNRQLARRRRLAADLVASIESHDARRRRDADAEVEAVRAQHVSKTGIRAVGAVEQHDVAGDLRGHRALDHVERQIVFRSEDDVLGDARFGAPSGVVGPRLGQVELEVDGDLLRVTRDCEADSDLAIRDFARRARVLPLHADRVFSLFQEAGVVDDPHRDRLALLDLLDGVPRGREPHGSIVPRCASEKMKQLVLNALRLLRVGARARSDRLGALALAVAENAERVHRERLALAPVFQVNADALSEELFEPCCRCDFGGIFGHEVHISRKALHGKVFDSSVRSAGSLTVRISSILSLSSVPLITSCAACHFSVSRARTSRSSAIFRWSSM